MAIAAIGIDTAQAGVCHATQDYSSLRLKGRPTSGATGTSMGLHRRDATSNFYEDSFNGRITHQVYFHPNGPATVANGPGSLAAFIFNFKFKNDPKPWYFVVDGKETCDLNLPGAKINNIDGIGTEQAL